MSDIEAVDSIGQRATVNASWSVLSEVIPRAIVLVVSIYLARTLTAASFGLLALAQAYPQFLATSLEMGVAMYGTRELARDRSRGAELLNGLLSLRLAAAGSVFLLYAGLVTILLDQEQRLVFLVAAPFLLAYAGLTDWVQRAHERFELTAVANVAGALLLLAGCLVLVRDGSQVLLAAALWSGSYLTTTVLSLVITRRALKLGFRPVLAPGRWWAYARSSIFFSLAGLLGFGMYQVTIGILGATWPGATVAHFAAPYRLVMAVATTGYMVTLAIYPILSTVVGQREGFVALTSTVARLLLVGGLPVSLLGASLAAPILRFVLGESYVEGAVVLSVLCVLIPFQLISYVLEVSLLAQRRERLRTLMSAVGLVVAAVMAPLIIPVYGSIGAAVVYVTAVGGLTLALFVGYRRSIGESPLALPDLARPLVPAVAMAILLPWGTTSLELLRPTIAIGVYIVVAVAVGLLRPADLQWLRTRLVAERDSR